ncbi:MAG: DUF3800 domain-containing protein [Terriglobia bacterium]
MVIYLDESYDHTGVYFLLGALFILDHDQFLKAYLDLKRMERLVREDGTLRELKYTKIRYPKYERVATKALELFTQHRCYFRCVVIPLGQFDLNFYGSTFELPKIKRARAYKKFAEMLVEYNTPRIARAVLFADNMTRCKGELTRGDEFVEKMKDRFCYTVYDHDLTPYPPKLRHVQEVDSQQDQYGLLQLCDVILGCTLNGILDRIPSKRGRFKFNVRKTFQEMMGIKSFKKQDWQPLLGDWAAQYREQPSMEEYSRDPAWKYRIWFWSPRK